MQIQKADPTTIFWRPLEEGILTFPKGAGGEVSIADGQGRIYAEGPVRPDRGFRFKARGTIGTHAACWQGSGEQEELQLIHFEVRANTGLQTDKGVYGDLQTRLRNLLQYLSERRSHIISGRLYELQVCWFRDHVYTLKSQKLHIEDVKSGCEFFWDRQQPNGMIWDDVHANGSAPFPSYFGEALGPGFNAYEEDRKWILRRIPCESDVEYLAIEGLYHTWKASGDDAWLRRYLPKAEKAVAYMMSDPRRWSEANQLVRRPYTMDSWDFTNTHFYPGIDHRFAPLEGPWFHLHSDNSGFYAALWRMAEFYEALGDPGKATEYRTRAAEFRERANRLLFKTVTYAHMVPEKPMPKLKELVGDDDQRMSLSIGYTINRGLPTHEQATAILKEYQRRRKLHAKTSYAEWWTMDPMYTAQQWPHKHTGSTMPLGEYMNGAISPIVAGELARAAFDHGFEDYGADILRRVWDLTERDEGWLNDAYRRLPPDYRFQNPGQFITVNLKKVVNRGLRHGAVPEVAAWTDEGENDMRNLPVGRKVLAGATFSIIDPSKNQGRAVLTISGKKGDTVPAEAHIPIGARAKSLYFLQASCSPGTAVAALYDLLYSDGTEHRVYVRNGTEIGHWWGVAPLNGKRAGPGVARIGWQGANGTFGNVGMFVYGLDNPHPEKLIDSLCIQVLPGQRIMIAGLSLSDAAVEFDAGIRSYGAPANWAQSSVYHALMEGLVGINDTSRAFGTARFAPRWSATEVRTAECTLHYPASNGYASYQYKYDAKRSTILLEITGSFDQAEVHCLLPAKTRPVSVQLEDEMVPFTVSMVEKSRYVDFHLDGLPLGPVTIQLKATR